jgi:acetyl esterase/lipase
MTDPKGPYPVIVNLPSRGDYSIPVYLFVPNSINPMNCSRLPVVLDFHGGGFVLGSCLEQAPFCSKLARELEAVVITVDYRMGPIHKFPAAVQDAEDVLKAILHASSPGGIKLREAIQERILNYWLEAQKKQETSKVELKPPSLEVGIDTTRIAVSGFSSGGNLALNTALSLTYPEPEWPSLFPADFPRPIPLLLYYPSFDSRQLPSERTMPPHAPVSKSFWSETNDLLAPSYLPREISGHPRASPGLADLKGLHPMAKSLLVLPGVDSLAEQSEVWVKKVADSGRDSDLRVERYPGMKHGWTQMPGSWLSEAERHTKKDIYDKTVTFIQRLWNDDTSVLDLKA